MSPSRRLIVSALLSAGALAGAGCGDRINRRSRDTGLDSERLAQGFTGLATRARPAAFDLGVMTLNTPAVWCANGDRPFPMQSVFKAPLAAAALAEVDAGRLRLNETIRIGPEDLSPPPSRLNRLFPGPSGKDYLDVPAADLIALTVQESDNTAADAIMRRIGGPGAVTAWLRAHDIKAMRVDRYEREIQPDLSGVESFRAEWKDDQAWAAVRASIAPRIREAAMAAYLEDPRDTTTSQAALNFLSQLAGGGLLSPASTALLRRLMIGAAAGQGRLRAGLPAGAILAHKSGSSVTDLGLTPVTNDIGLVTLADGRRFGIAALMAGSTATGAQRDGVIADAARLAVSALI